MSRRLEAEMSSQAARMVPEPWGEIPYFFAEHWGAFATAIAVCPPIPGSLHADFERRLELDGSYFVYRQLSPVEACDLTGWLDLLLPTVWGPKADVARIALMIRVSSETICSAKGATRMELARRFPCPSPAFPIVQNSFLW